MAAQLINCRLSRGDAQPWGLRLQGGKDFGTPLLVQKVSSNQTKEKSNEMKTEAQQKLPVAEQLKSK